MTKYLRELAKTFLLNPALLKKQEYLFVLGHMRCYSTLISHILGSSAEIGGYCEMHQDYADAGDLLRLKRGLYRLGVTGREKRYLLDKILHGRYVISDEILLHPRVHLVILLREPEAALKSIQRMQRRFAGETGPDHMNRIVEYYCSQAEYLSAVAARAKGKALLIRAEDVVQRPRRVLDALERRLGLSEALSTEYRTYAHTGKRGYGDPSETILSGRIVDTRETYRDIGIPPQLLAKAREAYEKAWRKLGDTCVLPEDLGVEGDGDA